MTSLDSQPVIEKLTRNEVIHQETQNVLPLIHDLCKGLAVENIAYCHWKSNDVIERSASGENDLDLLVSRVDISRFSELLYSLGFKLVKTPQEKQMPGVLDFFGYDEEADRLIHVHAHYQLILGHDMTKNYRLPIEKPYLESASQKGLFRIPALDFEYIVFIIRMIIKHSTWDVILGGQGNLKSSERRELDFLSARINSEQVSEILKRYLPYIDSELFSQCVQALQANCSIWTRIITGYQLQIKLQVYARRSLLANTILRIRNRFDLAFRRRVFKSVSNYQLERGGAMIALVGGDGAGKSTAISGLNNWLGENFKTTRVHMGKPDWSTTTIIVRGILKIGKILGLYPWELSDDEKNKKSLITPEYPWLLREVCRARDRYWTYRRAQRFAANGGLVILDRYPLPEIKVMDGPQAGQFLNPDQANRINSYIVKLEERYYKQIVPPDMVFVLRLNPEIAVQRKTDEDAGKVHERSLEIWQSDWEQTDYFIIDASQPKEEVLSDIKAIVWTQL